MKLSRILEGSVAQRTTVFMLSMVTVVILVAGIWQIRLLHHSTEEQMQHNADRSMSAAVKVIDNRMATVEASVGTAAAYADMLATDEEQAYSLLQRLIDADEDINQLSLSDMINVKGVKEKGDEIAVYYAYGDIVDSETESLIQQEHSIVANTVCKDLEKLANDDDVKAVVLRVNSPGGSAYASEQIWHAVQMLKAKKPVVVSMGGYAASGGYYISCGANYIYSEPTTVTGSIGIFGMFLDASGLLTEKLGVKFDEVKTNKHAAFGTMARPFNEEEIALLDQYIGRGYELFRKRVADGRKLSVDAVEEIAQGRVWLGNDALGIKLVDAIGSMDDAVKKAAQLAKLSEYKTKG